MSLVNSATTVPYRRVLSLTNRTLGANSLPSLLLLSALILSTLIPTEFSFLIGNVRLTLYRLFLVACTPWVLWNAFAAGTIRLGAADWALTAAVAWVVVTLMVNEGFGVGVQTGGIAVLETLVPYFLARLTVTDSEKFTVIFKLFLIVTIPLVLVGILEGISHTSFIHTFARLVTGNSFILQDEQRLGIYRAQGPFDHPIHYGVWMVMLLPAFFYLRQQKVIPVPLAYLWAVAGLFFSLSSGPWSAAILQVLLMIYERFTRRIDHRWLYLISVCTIIYTSIDLLSNRGAVKIFVSFAALHEFSAYYRTIIFDVGIQNIYAHPVFGLGEHSWARYAWMSNSVDNYWLLIAMRYGVPTFAGYALGFGSLLYAVNRKMPSRDGMTLLDACRMSWTFGVVALIFMGASVAYWHMMEVLVWTFLGLGGWMIAGKRTPLPAAPQRIARRFRPAGISRPAAHDASTG